MCTYKIGDALDSAKKIANQLAKKETKMAKNEIINLEGAPTTKIELVQAQSKKIIDEIALINCKVESNAKQTAYLLYHLRLTGAHAVIGKKSFEKYAMDELANRGIHYNRASVSNLSRYGAFVRRVPKEDSYVSIWATDTDDFTMTTAGILIQGFSSLPNEQIKEKVQELLDGEVINYGMSRTKIQRVLGDLPEWTGKKKLKAVDKEEKEDEAIAEAEAAEKTVIDDNGNPKAISRADLSDFIVNNILDSDITPRGMEQILSYIFD